MNCQNCQMPLTSWTQKHTYQDCQNFKVGKITIISEAIA